MKFVFKLLSVVFLFLAFGTMAEENDKPSYREKFLQQFRQVTPVPSLDDYLNLTKFDSQYLGESLEKSLVNINNDSAGIAWGTSYLMMALNEMNRATGDAKYLKAMQTVADAVNQARDDKRGVKLFTGELAPIWSCEKYSPKGRCAYAVHTGIIVYPILDFLTLVKAKPELRTWLGERYEELLSQMQQSLDFHNRQWSTGPNPGEGYYYGKDQEPVLEGKVIPANRQSSMGRGLWLSWKLSGREDHRDKALAIGTFLKNRLPINTDHDAYVWPYQINLDSQPWKLGTKELREKIGQGEDISHGSLTMSFFSMLAEDGQVFDKTDMERFGRTVTALIAPAEDGILHSTVDGSPQGTPDPSLLALPGRWLRLVPYTPEVYPRIAAFCLNYLETPHPLDVAMLLKYRKSQ